MKLKKKSTENKVRWIDWEEVSQDALRQAEDRQAIFLIPSIRGIYQTLRRNLIRAPHMNTMKRQSQQLVAYVGSPDFWRLVSSELLVRHQHINEINQVAQDNANLSRCEQGCQSIARSNCLDCTATCWNPASCSFSICQADCDQTCYVTSCENLCSWKSDAAPITGGL
jgi:hypothetical protein